MKSSTILATLTTIALAPTSHGIQSRLPFAVAPAGSLSRHQKKLLLHLRGGEQIITPDEGVDTIVDADMEGEGIVEDGDMVETPASPISKEAIMSMLLPIKSTIENMGFFYINSLNSYPVQTITLTAVAVILLISIVASLVGGKAEEVEIAPKDKKPFVEPPKPEPKPVVEPPATPAGVGSRGLIAGLGTAAATTFAIYQAVSAPSSEDGSGDGSEDGSEGFTVESESEEHANTVFKAQEILLSGQRLIKNVCSQMGGEKEIPEDQDYNDEDANEAAS